MPGKRCGEEVGKWGKGAGTDLFAEVGHEYVKLVQKLLAVAFLETEVQKLVVRSLLALGASKRDVAKIIAPTRSGSCVGAAALRSRTIAENQRKTRLSDKSIQNSLVD